MAGDTLEEEKKGTEEDRKGSPFSAPPWPQLTKNRAEHEREGFWRVSVSWGRVRNSEAWRPRREPFTPRALEASVRGPRCRQAAPGLGCPHAFSVSLS